MYAFLVTTKEKEYVVFAENLSAAQEKVESKTGRKVMTICEANTDEIYEIIS